MLMIVFQVSILDNIVPLLLGVTPIATVKIRSAARSYLLPRVYRLVINHDRDANCVPVNDTEN